MFSTGVHGLDVAVGRPSTDWTDYVVKVAGLSRSSCPWTKKKNKNHIDEPQRSRTRPDAPVYVNSGGVDSAISRLNGYRKNCRRLRVVARGAGRARCRAVPLAAERQKDKSAPEETWSHGRTRRRRRGFGSRSIRTCPHVINQLRSPDSGRDPVSCRTVRSFSRRQRGGHQLRPRKSFGFPYDRCYFLVSLYHELHSTDVSGRRDRRTSLTQIIREVSVTRYELVKSVINSGKGWGFIMKGQPNIQVSNGMRRGIAARRGRPVEAHLSAGRRPLRTPFYHASVIIPTCMIIKETDT
ncbi:hypothetical protein EVAR_37428_1 [Eumeta japonica]|uniref:Uncharacterized protein n=1 Tax=Eumeta variegata TaxID=151549 RepID=A0A4C1WE32_EUMVA|nr:hypothetical protein EVAR_37428_1 [Eumeta japonica]